MTFRLPFRVFPAGPVGPEANGARMLPASGRRSRFASSRRGLVLLALGLPGACVPVPGGGGPEAPAPAPSIAAGGALPAGEVARGRILLDSARLALDTGDWSRARDQARSVIEDFPTVPGSTDALRILSEASLALDAGDEGAEAAARWSIRLAEVGEEDRGGAAFLEGANRILSGDTLRGLDRIASIHPGMAGEWIERGVEFVDAFARGLSDASLRNWAATGGTASPVLAPLLLEGARIAHFEGEDSRARGLAERALRGEPPEPWRGTAQRVAGGEARLVYGIPPVLGAILSFDSSPALVPVAEAIREGIEVALADPEFHDLRPRLRVESDRGRPAEAEEAARRLVEAGVTMIVGPLLDRELAAAAGVGSGELILLSPTARALPEAPAAVFSLAAPDPGGAELLARWAREQGLRTGAILHASTPDARAEGDAFARVFEGSGGNIVARREFAPGTSFFEGPLTEIRESGAEFLLLPLEPEEIEVVAPQTTFYGLDSVGVRILGTGAWASDEVLERVAARHTDGVIAATSRPAGDAAPSWRSFIARWEEVHQRTFRGPISALGYDAARILLRAQAVAGSDPGRLREAVEATREYEGASGRISFRDGRFVREFSLVRIEGGLRIPIDP